VFAVCLFVCLFVCGTFPVFFVGVGSLLLFVRGLGTDVAMCVTWLVMPIAMLEVWL
jgi:hypothetical protein